MAMASVKEIVKRNETEAALNGASGLGLLNIGNNFVFAKILGGPRPSSAPTKLRQCIHVIILCRLCYLSFSSRVFHRFPLVLTHRVHLLTQIVKVGLRDIIGYQN
jgi:hypothetical protein